MADIDNIQFKHTLYDSHNKPVEELAIQLQFYSVNSRSWMSLTDELMVSYGELKYSLTIPYRIPKNNQTIRVVREVLRSGGIPSFRIINANTKSKLPEVIASTFNVTTLDDNKLTIDFGKSWLLDPERYITKDDHIIIATHIPLYEFTHEINAIKIEKEKAVTRISQLESTIESLSKEYNALDNQLTETQNNVELQNKYIADLKTDLQTANTNLDNERELRLSIEAEKINLETKVSDITKEKNNLEEEKAGFLENISKLQADIQREKEIVSTKDKELQNKQETISSLQDKNKKLEHDLEEAKDYSATDHPNKLSASKVYGSIVNDVIKADEELVNSKYKLANVSLHLKTTVEKGPEGTIFGLLDYESAKDVNSAAISDISIDIVPSSNTETASKQKMPNVLGLTETAVRKILLNSDLRLDAVYHATDDNSLVAGQSFKQSPAPNTAISEGQEVIVIFAKPIN